MVRVHLSNHGFQVWVWGDLWACFDIPVPALLWPMEILVANNEAIAGLWVIGSLKTLLVSRELREGAEV